MYDVMERQATATSTSTTTDAAIPGKATYPTMAGPAVAGPAAATGSATASRGVPALAPELVTGLPMAGAVPVTDDQGCVWLMRNDRKFECIQAPPQGRTKVHDVIDPAEQAEAWQALWRRTHGQGPVTATASTGLPVRGSDEGTDPDRDRDPDQDPDRDRDGDGDKEPSEKLVIGDAVQGFSALGHVIQKSAPQPGDGLSIDCQIRLPIPLTSVGWLVGGLTVSAVHDASGYALTMTGNLGLAASPGEAVFFALASRVSLTGKSNDPQRAAEMLGLALETYIRSFGTLPLGLGVAGPKVADAIFGKDHVFKAVKDLTESDSYGATKGAEGQFRAADPKTGVEVVGRGGVAEENELTKHGATTSQRFVFTGSLDFGPVAFSGSFNVPMHPGDPKGATFSGSAQGLLDINDPKRMIVALSGGIAQGTSALLRIVSAAVSSSPDGTTFVKNLAALGPSLEAAVNRGVTDATVALPGLGAAPAGGKFGVVAGLTADAGTKDVTLTVSTVSTSSVSEPVTGNQLGVTKKSQLAPPKVISHLPQ